MEKSEQINELAGALAKAQGKFKTLTKGRTATVKMKSGASYSYQYADLHDVMESVKGSLSENGLSLSQSAVRVEGRSDYNLLTYLFHSSGQFVSNSTPIIAGVYSDGGPQAFASSLTYSRRYGACALLGVVADEDDDSQIADDSHKNKTKFKTPAQYASESDNKVRPTQAEIGRLFGEAKKAGWTEENLREHMRRVLGFESTKELTYLQWENLVEVVKMTPKLKEQHGKLSESGT